MNGQMIFIAMVAACFAAPAGAMEVQSANAASGAMLATQQVKTECGGANISPALAWSGAPVAAKSFAVTMFDPDAHGGWWHWIVFDIPGDVASLPQGAGSGGTLPKTAAQGANDFGDSVYGGACPPPGSGLHHYEITVWAMAASSLPFSANAKGEEIGAYLKAHAIASAKLVPVYQR
jgi:Raf kinase inhibitor-like YbhB/YbcL family protein